MLKIVFRLRSTIIKTFAVLTSGHPSMGEDELVGVLILPINESGSKCVLDILP